MIKLILKARNSIGCCTDTGVSESKRSSVQRPTLTASDWQTAEYRPKSAVQQHLQRERAYNSTLA